MIRKQTDHRKSFTEDELNALARDFAEASLNLTPPSERSYRYFKDDLEAIRAHEEAFLQYARTRVAIIAKPSEDFSLMK
jgi:hypothetical protein